MVPGRGAIRVLRLSESGSGWAYHIGRKALYMMRASSSSSEGSASRKTRSLSGADIINVDLLRPPSVETDSRGCDRMRSAREALQFE